MLINLLRIYRSLAIYIPFKNIGNNHSSIKIKKLGQMFLKLSTWLKYNFSEGNL